jgi:D-lactate dehydrogenase (cytochrome)
MGGVVSTNAAGAATFKYGTTRSWVEAITVVLAGGDVLDLRRGDVRASPDGRFEIELHDRTVRLAVPAYRMPAVPKVSAGYYASPGMDLVDLFIGAEGTLGVITSITVRTCPRPATALALVSCPSRGAGLALVARLRDASKRTWSDRDVHGVDVSAIEHMDRRSLELARSDGADRASEVTVPADTEMALLVTLELPAEEDGRQAFDEIGRALEADAPDTPLVRFCGVLAEFRLLDRAELALPDDHRRQTQLLALREAVPSAVNRRIGRAQREIDRRIEKVAADVIVPFDRLAGLMDCCDDELRRGGLDGAVWGHISDGNLHPNVMPRTAEELAAGRNAVLAIGRAAIALGGAPLAEHGVGRNRVKQQLMRELYGEDGVEAMRRIKRALDPGRTMAPGVLGL